MREILFRGFHPDENGPQEITLDGIKIKGRWVQGDFCHPCHIVCEEIGDSVLGTNDVVFSDYDVLPETVGQYINLDDCDGQKIFDGDVVDICANDEIGEIEYDDDEAKFVVRRDGNILTDFSCYYGSDLHVVGNIFSNPDLIGGAEE